MHDDLECDTISGSDTVRHYAAYMNVIQGLSLLADTIVTPNGDRMPYVKWITDSIYVANTRTWNKFFKQYDTIWSKENFDTLGFKIDTFEKVIVSGRPPKLKYDTVEVYDTVYKCKPWYESRVYVYDQILKTVDSIWDNVSFYDLISTADGYSIEYKRDYYINAELRVYDEKGTYSKTDSKEVSIN